MTDIHRLGLAHFTVLEVPPLDLVPLAGKAGFSSIGLRLHPAFPGGLFHELPPGSELLREMRRRLDGEGVRVHDVEFVTIDERIDPASLAPLLETAQELGAQRLSVCGDDPDRARMAESLAAVCDVAATYGLGVDIEFMGWRRVDSLGEAIRVLEAAQVRNGGVLIDALHLARTGGSPADLKAVSPGLIRSVQICDAPAAGPCDEAGVIREARSGRLPPGEGELPLPELVAALPAEAAISVEVPVESALPPERRLKHLFDAATTLLERRCATGAKI